MDTQASEFDLIARIRERVTSRDDVLLGIGDDAAVLQVAAGNQLVVAMDTLNSGVHFPPDTAPADIGWKVLAVNLSDLAAMGAKPAWCTLSLSLPSPDMAWVDAFLDGFLALASTHRVALVGGDTTRGPLSVCVTAFGSIADGKVMRRDGALAGDDLWVTGTLGDAAASLAQWRAGSSITPALRARLDRPSPRVAFGIALADLAHACIDVSDGLLADLAHVCAQSGVGMQVSVDALPASSDLMATVLQPQRRIMQASGGDDYELCFTAPVNARDAIISIANAQQLQVSRIGTVTAGDGVQAVLENGASWVPAQAGYTHFVD